MMKSGPCDCLTESFSRVRSTIGTLHCQLRKGCTGSIQVAESDPQVALLRLTVARGAAAFAQTALPQLVQLADSVTEWCLGPDSAALYANCSSQARAARAQQVHWVKALRAVQEEAAKASAVW
jgi:hypothetical protein